MRKKSKDKFSTIIEHIKKVYLTYNRPLIVGFSGGKDSTLILQLVWEAIEALPRERIKQDIYVITVDTLVETPAIESYILENIKKINEAAKKQSLPFKAHLLTPLIENSFWVNLLGRGYPAPSRMFRWCTERLKIEPVDRFIMEHVDQWGEATVVLGARSDESASRSQVLSKKVRDKLGLSKHPSLPAAYVYTPIEKLTTDDVWSYLMAEDNRWGMDNNVLKKLYAQAAGGECPMVLDKTTPACGNSRFGCWVCTLVQKDTTMENLIEMGEKWMKPLLDIRDLLSETQDPKKKHIYRDFKRRNGKISFIKDKEGNILYDEDGKPRLVPGPYKPEWKQVFLRKVLKAQKDLKKHGPDPDVMLITKEEVEMIRDIWHKENPAEEDVAPIIYKEETGNELFTDIEDGVQFSFDDKPLLNKICEKEDIQADMIAKLIEEERRMQGLSRRSGILNKIDKIFKEEWRTPEEVKSSIKT